MSKHKMKNGKLLQMNAWEFKAYDCNGNISFQ